MRKIYGNPLTTPINPEKFGGSSVPTMFVTINEFFESNNSGRGQASKTSNQIYAHVQSGGLVYLVSPTNGSLCHLSYVKTGELDGCAGFIEHGTTYTRYYHIYDTGYTEIEKANLATKTYVDNAIAEVTKEKQWELIETITITEENAVRITTRTQEPDGTPYNFEAMMVETIMQPAETAGYLSMQFHNHTGTYVSFYINNGMRTSVSRVLSRVFPLYDRMFGCFTSPVLNEYDVPNYYHPVIYSSQNINKSPINKFVMSMAADRTPPIGSVINIWGVRADA